ncbi:hypothetical protein CLN94_13160 [Pseudothioclava arenosa]|uniref:Uncharacterized protein n=2 Tax=Pseudothioclava arenosa TaxID=1795308 RepID=A0A2A4CLV0_9RHOB|nr:hypothetical protein CLN94_13160 [Pseudothioclava arenosa]
MNMPFELGMDLGVRRAGNEQLSTKQFLIFEDQPYETKRTLSDLGGQDIVWHKGDYQLVIKGLRDFLSVQVGVPGLPGATKLKADYEDCSAWTVNKKMDEGHTEREALALPTAERLAAMKEWIDAGKPAV